MVVTLKGKVSRMPHKETFLLPLWIDITSNAPAEVLKGLNTMLTEFFEAACEAIAENGHTINVEWSINQHIRLNDREAGEPDGQTR